jgi:dienelactone hydrolase
MNKKLSLRQKHKKIYKVTLIISLSSSVIALAGLLFFFIDPIAFRLFIFQPVREFIFFHKELGLPHNWNRTEKIRIPPAKRIEIFSNEKNNIKIVADLRLPQQEGLSPALLLLHGSSPWGRKNGLISLLGYRFQSLGWITLSPDARGFGETNDPQNIKKEDSWSVKYDVKRCLEFLYAHPRTDPNRIYIIGHSMGAAHALEGAIDDTNAKALVLISPPRFPNGIKAGLWRRTRFSSDRRLKCILPEKLVSSISLKSGIGYFIKTRLKNNSHIPILLVIGEHEGENTIKFFSDAAHNISQPISLNTVKKAGHYFGVYNFFGSDIVFYRPDLFYASVSLMLQSFN